MAENRFGFQFVGIDLIFKAMAPRTADAAGLVFSFDISSESSVRKEAKLIYNFVKVNIREDQETDILATFTVVCVFNISNFDAAVTLNERGIFDIEKNLDLYLKSASISTIRGVIWTELRGTYLHNAILPVVDVQLLTNVAERQIISEKGELIQKNIPLSK